jgi:hypothetical protein
MYCKSNQPSIPPENFELPVAVKLSPDNRWVIMAELIPWAEFEAKYAEKFSEKMGAPAKHFGWHCPSRKERTDAIAKQLQ